MAFFWKTLGLILIALILWLAVDKREKDMASLLTLAACCAAGVAAAAYLEPVMDFLRQLENIGALETDTLKILLKAVGIGFVCEITGMVCADAGNSAMAGMIRFLSNAAILYISLPVLQTLMKLIQDILGVL